MEIGTRVKEESQMGATIKTEEETAATSTAYIDNEMNLNQFKQEPGLVQSLKSEPATWVKKEIVGNSSEDDSEQQCAQVASTPAGAGSLYEASSMSQGDCINVKRELEETEIGPTVLQHMDIHYARNKNTVYDCKISMRCSGVKKNVEDKLRDSLTPQEAVKKEWIPVLQSYQHGVQEHLAVCSVHVMRMDVFQCDLCHTVFAGKRQLIQHLQACCPRTSFNVKFRKTNEQTAADYKATSYNCSQTSTEVDYDETRMKSHLGQQKYLQKHQHQQHTTSSSGFKCNRTFHKPHLLVECNKLHQRKNSKAVMTRGSVAGPSNESGDTGTKTTRKPFECKVCEKAYPSKVDLKLHKRSHTKVKLKNNFDNYESHIKKKPYRQNEKFAKSVDLTKNMGVHTGEKPFPCKICEARFARSGGLTRHITVHTGEKPFQCKICDTRFAQKSALTMHVRVHTGEKPFQCKLCGARFARSGGLTQHMRVHTGEKPFQCKICNTRCAQKSDLTKHMIVHTGEKPYKCETCDSKFARKSDLTIHTRIHTGEKPFQCKLCDSRFAKTSVLTQHMRVHTGEKHYQCVTCDSKFAHQGYLTIHMRVHTGEKPFKCKFCVARFAHSGGLTQHIRVHTGEKPFQCMICDTRFAQKSALTKHIRVHTGEKPYQCGTCDSKFARKGDLTIHMRVHTGEKPFQCKICDARFAQKSALTKHMTVHTG